MRVLILNDRVHKKTGALNLLKSLCDGIAPPHEISWVNIHDLSMQTCEGCLKCRPCGECVLPEDNGHEMSRMIFSADALVIGLDSSLENLSPVFKNLLDRSISAVEFQNQQGKTCPWRKGRPAVVVSLEKTDRISPEPSQRADIIHNSLLWFLESGGFKTLGTLAVPLKEHSSPEMLLLSQARSMGSRLSSFEAGCP